MHTLPGFWHAAATLSGRLDLSLALQTAQPVDSLTAAQLSDSGICSRHQARLRRARSIETEDPFLLPHDPDYPSRLRNIPYAPPVLFYRGNPALLNEPSVAIVGARRCTSRGRSLASRLATDLVSAGIVTVSGLAYGIDAAAHDARPDRTMAVLGQGLAQASRGQKGRSVQDIVDAGGLILSEFMPSFPASKATFPQRNRVISGIALGTVVIEAGMRSGSRITARHTLTQGRELMVVPGHPMDDGSKGCNELLFHGAGLVRDVSDVLFHLGMEAPSTPSYSPSCPAQRAVLEALTTGQTLDHIVAITGQSVPEAIVAVAELELTGMISRLPGDRLCLWSTP